MPPSLMARAYPASTFVGNDLNDEALQRGRGEAAAFGLSNVSFESQDVAVLPASWTSRCTTCPTTR